MIRKLSAGISFRACEPNMINIIFKSVCHLCTICLQMQIHNLDIQQLVLTQVVNNNWNCISCSLFHYYRCQQEGNQLRKNALYYSLLYEIMALYHVKLILREISASRQDRRVLQKSKIIRIEFLSKWGMLQTSRYV